MLISLIVAMDKNRGIGRDNAIPWRLQDDQAYFKKVTMGHHVVMGRRTWLSIGRPLPGRRMVVLTRNPAYRAEDVDVAPSLDAALALARGRGESETFIIGGQAVYRAALPLADRIYLTRVQAGVQADTFFPAIAPADWKVVDSWAQQADERNEYAFTFELLERRQPASA